MAEIENLDDDELIPDAIAVLPPVNANEYNTDEDSGDENEVDINNLPGSQLMTEVEFIDDEIIDLVVKYSNLYAIQHNRQGDIHSSEIKCFVGVLLLSGYNSFPRRSMYWENNSDAGNTLVYSAISRDRFSFIMQNLHLNDNNNLENTNKFSKLRPLFSTLNEKFQSYTPLEECHSVDWYPITAVIDQNSSSEESQFVGVIRYGWEQLKRGASVVLQFADIIQSQCEKAPFHIFCDNFFTSLCLLAELTSRGLKCTGTLRENSIQ
ncbi:piggyBac transposable element-derived protein 3-like [Anthonomus grandis grandis]|uniref:piggyBac transposable element-derived protein 3-like n=1 Tax=Anthonomus grandis grandis TaxID=2921223 RepID=UPI00216676FC|nr:piggyBac transposable element-derived protein 3-like [Anthonomus grandis grandis]